MLDYQDCFEKGLIKTIPASKEQADQSALKASDMVGEARANLEDERYNSAALMAYLAMFNAARALLFKDGYREKSHYCVARYVEANYSSKIGMNMIHMLDAYRETRHEIQYSTIHNASKEEATAMVDFADDFIEKIDEILSEK